MEKHFCNYEQALVLKELGFDEPCFAYYSINNIENKLFYDIDPDDGELTALNQNQFYHNNLSEVGRISAPLKSQVLQWFRDKHNTISHIEISGDEFFWCLLWIEERKKFTAINRCVTYEESENKCITKLIEIVKNK